jgi:hypothetical protein
MVWNKRFTATCCRDPPVLASAKPSRCGKIAHAMRGYATLTTSLDLNLAPNPIDKRPATLQTARRAQVAELVDALLSGSSG